MQVSEFIVAEGNTCFVALFWGMILALEYDCIRIFRRVFKHKRVWTMAFEDIVYWIIAAFQVFGLIYEVGDGVVRGFLVAMMVIGAVLYRYAFGRYLVVYVSKLFVFLLKPLKKVLMSVTIKIKKKVGRWKASFRERSAKRKLQRDVKRSRKDETGVKKRKRDAV